MDGIHRIRTIPDEVQDYLLKLDSVPRDKRGGVGKLTSQNNPISMKITQRQSNHLPRSGIQIQPLSDTVFLAEECAQARDHIRCTVAIANRSPGRFTRTVDVRWIQCQ